MVLVVELDRGGAQTSEAPARTKSAEVSFHIGQLVNWKNGNNNNHGIVRWLSPSGLFIGVDFALEITEPAPGLPPYSQDFFEFRPGHGRVLEKNYLTPAKNGQIFARPLLIEKESLSPNFPKEFEPNNNCISYLSVVKNEAKPKPSTSISSGNVYDRMVKLVQEACSKNKIIETSLPLKSCEEEAEVAAGSSLKIIPKPLINFEIFSRSRGVQWQANSCYLDSTVFALFFSTSAFDDVILSNTNPSLSKQLDEQSKEIASKTRQILRNNIVYALRKSFTCTGVEVAKLREVLAAFNKKLINSYMDAEDFLFILLEQALGLEEFIYYSNYVKDFIHQIVIDVNNKKSIESIQNLLGISMNLMDTNLKFNGVPRPALIIEMPRCDGKLVGHKAIVPNLRLDITELMARDCICGKPATWICQQCKDSFVDQRFRWTSFCDSAIEDHVSNNPGHNLIPLAEFNKANREVLDLIAVICVKSAHYTAFAKCGNERLAPWLYQNSLFKVLPVKNLGEWLDKFETSSHDQKKLAKLLNDCPADIARILVDSHICIYHKS